jgi:hypothetical protein
MEAAKNKKVILIVSIIALVGLALYLWWKKKQDVQKAEDITPPPSGQDIPVTKQSNTNTTPKKSTFPLEAGSKGKEVKQLQAYLLKQGAQFPLYGIDGSWGVNSTETTNNVKKILNVDKVDEGLFKKLGMDKIKVS